MTSATAQPTSAVAPRRARSGAARPDLPSPFGYWLFVVFIVLEFDRPPVLSALKLQMLIALGMPLLWLTAKEKPWSPVLTAMTAFFVSTTLMIPFAWNYYAVYFTSRTLFSSVGLAITMSWLFSTRSALRYFYWAWLPVMAWVALFGIRNGGRGTGGFLGDENDLALGCVAAFPFAWYGFEREKGWKRWAAAACGGFLAMGVVASNSRGGFVGLLCAALYCFLTSANKLRNLGIGLVAALGMLLAAPSSFWKEMGTITESTKEGGTGEAREFLWITATNMWKEYPVFGAGGGNFNYQAGLYQPRGGRWDQPAYAERNWSGTTVHSSYFQLLSETGAVGVGLFGAMVFLHFRGIARVRKRLRRGKDVPSDARNDFELLAGSLAGGMIGALACGAFLSAAYYPYFYLYAGVGAALTAAVDRELGSLPAKGRSSA